MKFDRQPELRFSHFDSSGLAVYQLCEDLVFRLGLDGPQTGIVVRIPAKFASNFASVPRWLRWLYPADGPWRLPSLLHDYLYTIRGCSRFLADALFRESMAHEPLIPWRRRLIMYYAVRLFAGGHHWSRKRS